MHACKRSRRSFGACLASAAFGLWLVLGAAPSMAQDSILLRLHIEDPVSGSELDVRITRQVQRGTSALEAMRALIPVVAKSFPGTGEFVTGLCGVQAPSGTFWALYVDGERSPQGVSALRVDQPMHIRWTLERLP